MKFNKLEAFYIVPEMKKKFSLGEVDGLPRDIGPIRDMVLLKGTTSSSVESWSAIDTVKLPIYGAESSIESWALMQEVGGNFIKKEFQNAREAVYALGYLVDHHIFKAAFANLFIDALAIENNLPLATLLGGTKSKVDVGVSIPKTASFEEIAKKIEQERFKRIKIKVGPNKDDYEKVKAIKRRFPTLSLMVDANSSFDLKNPQHRKLLYKYGSLNLLMIEQPLAHNDIQNHVALQQAFNKRNIPGKICLDESIYTLDDLKQAIDGGIPIINIKVTRVGGLDIAKTMIEYCQRFGVDTWIGGMGELTTPGKAHSLAMASHPGVTLPSDISGTSAYFIDGNDPCKTPMERESEGAFIRIPKKVGRGWDVDEKKLARITKHKKVFK